VRDRRRFTTYIIRAPRRSGQISLNGAAARKGMIGDLLIIASYSLYREVDLESYRPVVALVDEHNRPISYAGKANATGESNR
jgi:aspartate 1-decarboxylase